ncbi:DUF2625 family protein [Nocardiopsis lambiniae]|uniref:DUF2625 family protein n=1 Tax=Nocardiopsis lambiniae TaxID=3075539 RepID=A0ABU2M5E1_9ACTN|nr:DUF2625 family protein [Nocardiopsis sp. DSM 44743]MDT0327395.1 DUF2625 family protein [Nocardiopsis sp. DSM 44743]
MRELSELVEVERPGWPVVIEHLERARLPVRALPGDPDRGRTCLHRLQITARSFLGAMALESGGLLVDDGWLRVYGGGGPELPGLGEVNDLSAAVVHGPPVRLIVGHDVLGGIFALNGPGCEDDRYPGRPGEMVYFAPDSLAWEPLEAAYSSWLPWMLEEHNLENFYADLRWPGWRESVAGLTPDQGLAASPPLWTKEAARNPAAVSRRPVPFGELVALHREFRTGMDGADPGPFGTL